LTAFEYVLLAWGAANAVVLLVALVLSGLRRCLQRRTRRRGTFPRASGQDAWSPGRDAWS
jgi:hypothetical protein